MLCTAAILLGATPSIAAELQDTGALKVRLDTTLRYTVAARIGSQNPYAMQNANTDDGDRNFAAGLISNRLDIRSALDLALENAGIHASAAAWYDTAYHVRTDNRSAATYNVLSVPSTAFARPVRDLHGAYVELREAFGYADFTLGNVPVALRVGRQTLTWGESFFYDSNSIGSAQSPTDYSGPLGAERGSYANNPYLPVNQVTVTAQLPFGVSVSLYDQLEWRASRLSGDGSYMSYADFVGAGAERLFLSSGQYLLRLPNRTRSAAGQFGVALHAMLSDISVGVYALHYSSKDPQIVTAISYGPSVAGSYRLVYPKDITLVGASFSAYADENTIAGEFSVRQNAPLDLYQTDGHSYGEIPGLGAYAKGTLAHLQLSASTTYGRTDLWDSADLAIEATADDVIDLRNDRPPVPGAWDRLALKARAQLEARYFQILPNLDLTLPIGVGYNLSGHSFSAYQAQNAGAGDIEIGVTGTYLTDWTAGVSISYFVGSPSRQPLSDRSFVALSLSRTL